jgi:outer membrane receptor for ferrienterochelin and colicin
VDSLQTTIANFSADIGRSSGGLLNVGVKSGSNKFHGSGVFYFRDDSLQAKGAFGGPTKPQFGAKHFGLSLGGPLKRDVAFFFIAFDRNHDNEPITSGARDVVRRRIVENFVTTTFTSANLTTKIDITPSTRDGVTARYSFADGHGLSPGISQGARLQDGSNLQSQKDRQHQLTSSWSHSFTNKLLNVVLLNFLTFQNQFRPVTTAPQIVFPSINVGSNFQADQTTLQRRIQFKDDVSWVNNKHNIKFGADYNHLSLPQPNNFNLFGPGIIFVPCDFAGDPGCPTATQDANIPVQFSLINRQTLMEGPSSFGTRGVIPAISDNVIGLYAQDNFRLSTAVTLNLGLRWDYDQDYIGRNQVNRARPGRRKPSKKDLQPRLGIVWTIGRVIIRGGYGTHFQQNFLETRQLELLADGVRLPLQRSFGGDLSNPFGSALGTRPDIFVTNNELAESFTHSFSVASETDFRTKLNTVDLSDPAAWSTSTTSC